MLPQGPATIGSEKISQMKRRVYFVDSKQISPGQPLCYQESTATASATKGFGLDVEVPNAGNNLNFAGIADCPELTQGPAWVDMIIPRNGEMLKVMLSDSIAVAAGDQLEIVSAVPTATASSKGAFQKQTWATGTMAGTAIVAKVKAIRAIAVDSIASTAAGSVDQNLKMVQFLP